jgi:hypothetical protein
MTVLALPRSSTPSRGATSSRELNREPCRPRASPAACSVPSRLSATSVSNSEGTADAPANRAEPHPRLDAAAAGLIAESAASTRSERRDLGRWADEGGSFGVRAPRVAPVITTSGAE